MPKKTTPLSPEMQLLQIDSKGRFVLPQKSRTTKAKYYSYQLDNDGTIHLFPVVGVITSKQAYFWTEQWQKGEKDADQDLGQAKTKKLNSKQLKSFLNKLDT